MYTTIIETEMEADTYDIGETDVSNVIVTTDQKRIIFHWNLHLMILID